MRAHVEPVHLGERPHLRVRVAVPREVEHPSGEVVVEVTGEDYRVRRRKDWSGGDVRFVTARVEQRGTYAVRAWFRSSSNEMRDQSAACTFRVKARSRDQRIAQTRAQRPPRPPVVGVTPGGHQPSGS